MQRLIVLRLHPVKPDAVFKSELRGRAPVVLDIPFDVPGAVLAVQHLIRLLQRIIIAKQRVRKRPVGIQRVIRVTVEVDDAVDGSERGLVLQALMQVNAAPECVGIVNLRNAVGDVVGVVEVEEGCACETGGGGIGNAAVVPILHQLQLVGIRERHRVGHPDFAGVESIRDRGDVQVVARRAEDELVGERGIDDGSHVGDVGPSGSPKTHRSERYVVAGVPLAVSHAGFVVSPDVTRVRLPLVVDVVIAAVDVLAPRIGVGSRGLVIVRGVHADCVRHDLHAIRVKTILRDDIAGERRFPIRRIENGHRCPAAVVGLREVALTLERRGDRYVVQSLWHELALPFDSHENEKLVAVLIELSWDVGGTTYVETLGVVAVVVLLSTIHVVPPRIGVQVLVAVKEVARAMKIPGSGLSHDFDLRARRAPELGRL